MKTMVVWCLMLGVVRADSTVPSTSATTLAELMVLSQPAATVIRDGVIVGQTPLVIEVPGRQKMKLELRAPGYRDHHQMLQPEGRTKLHILLEPVTGVALWAQLADSVDCSDLGGKDRLSRCRHLVDELRSGKASVQADGTGWRAERPSDPRPMAFFRPTFEGRWEAKLFWP